MEQMTLIPMREPCRRLCEAEWGSLRCLEKNGYIYDYTRRKFIRDENGAILKRDRCECDYKRG